MINDNIKVALEVDADGVHIGQDDMSVEEARKLLGEDKIIGVSAHNVKEALKAQKGGADYLGVGAVCATSTKKDANVVSKEEIKKIKEAVDIPIVAIGGIKKDNIAETTATPSIPVPVKASILSFLQLREKKLSEGEFIKEAREMKKLAAQYQIPFVINDNIKVALEVDADGVHIGQDDYSFPSMFHLYYSSHL